MFRVPLFYCEAYQQNLTENKSKSGISNQYALLHECMQIQKRISK